MAWGAAIAAGASLAGGMLTNLMGAKEAQRNREFQAHMSSTAHQREVRDLERAGLNPIISATGGASTPSGSMASFENPVQSAVTSAIEAKSLEQAMEKQKAEISNINAQTDNLNMDTTVKSKDLPKAELMNKVYNVILKPIANKAEQVIQTVPKKFDNYKKDIEKAKPSTQPSIRNQQY